MDTNPFTAIQATLRADVYPAAPGDTQARAIALLVLFSLALILVVLSLGVRVWRGNFWLFRRANMGALIQPHPLTTYLVCSGCFLGLIYGYLEFDRRHNSFPSDLRNQMIWRTIPFLPLWSSAWCMAWATAIAPLVTKQSKPSVGYPILMNVYFIAGFFALYAAMIPLAIILNNHYNVLWDLYLQLDEALGAAAASFDQGVIPDVGALEGYKQQVADIFPSIIADWRRFWLVLTGFVAVLLVTFTAACISQFILLRRMLHTLKTRELTGSVHRAQLRSVSRAYWSIIFTSSMQLLLSGMYLVILALISSPMGLKTNSGIPRFVLWPIAVLGLICQMVTFARSFVHPSSHASHVSRAATPSPSVKLSSFSTSQGHFDIRRSDAMERYLAAGGRVHLVGFEEAAGIKAQELGREESPVA